MSLTVNQLGNTETQKRANRKLPIVYSNWYDIHFARLEKLHMFDAHKWGKIMNLLIEMSVKSRSSAPMISYENIHEPQEATKELLLLVHSQEYLSSLEKSKTVAGIIEVPLVGMLPHFIVDKYLLKKFRYQVAGTVMAARLALENKWAINIGGGFHHASANSGGGFCVYADISIAIKKLRQEHKEKSKGEQQGDQTQDSSFKVLIIDLDAHQGNGHETDFKDDKDVVIFDMYNRGIYPFDNVAKETIRIKEELLSYTETDAYLEKLKTKLDECFNGFHPDLIIYNAGTDCLTGDPLGRLDISDDGIKDRDEMVFRKAIAEKCPIVMVTSGGYQLTNAEVVAKSIWNLFEKKVIPVSVDSKT